MREYWLVDARGETPRFDLLNHESAGYVESEAKVGWVKSNVFGCAFRLIRKSDPLGQPDYALENSS